MATRKVNASFIGVTVSDADFDAPTFKRGIEDTVGDDAYLFDRLTGENGIDPDETINHSGNGRGCPLGLPLVNQYINADMLIESPTTKDEHGGVGEHVVAPFIVPILEGEDTIAVNIRLGSPHPRMQDVGGAYVRVFDLSMNEEAVVNFDFREDDTSLTARITGLTPGKKLLFPVIRSDLLQRTPGEAVDLGILRCASVHHGRRRPGHGRAIPPGDGAVAGVTTPSATEGMAHVDFDAAYFGDLQAIDGHITSRLARNINGKEENISGAPAGGNAAYVHEDHNGSGVADPTNPARSRFDAHTRSLYADEPEIAFPVWASTFGSFIFVVGTGGVKFSVDLAQPPTIGMQHWYTPWPKTVGPENFIKTYCLLPDFATTHVSGDDSNLKMAVLIISDGSTDVDEWELSVEADGDSAPVTASVVAGTGNTIWIAIVEDIPFRPDFPQETILKLERTSGSTTIGEIAVAAACLYFEPPT